MKQRLIIFTRFPRIGITKTRLIPALGPGGAAEIQRAMTEHTVSIALNTSGERDIEVRFDGCTAREMRGWLGDGMTYVPQGVGALGKRMARSFADAFAGDTGLAVVIGSDCPELSAKHIGEAFDSLVNAGCVLGPAHDGGYYLIGLTARAFGRVGNALFRGIAWGTGTVFSDTRAIAETNGLRVRVLEMLSDVDRPEDLDVWYRVRDAGRGIASRKSGRE